MISQAEENYLKAIFKILERADKPALTNAIAAEIQTSAASVTDMLKRLSDKQLIRYEKYRGVLLTPEGYQMATVLIRKHRLWEVFLVEKLGFAWDQVHELAEQLEHVHGDELINKLDSYLGHPRFDPHGDPIPDANGQWAYRAQVPLSHLNPGEQGTITGVDDHSSSFLQYLDLLGISLGVSIQVLDRINYDLSTRVLINGKEFVLSEKVCQNLFVRRG